MGEVFKLKSGQIFVKWIAKEHMVLNIYQDFKRDYDKFTKVTKIQKTDDL